MRLKKPVLEVEVKATLRWELGDECDPMDPETINEHVELIRKDLKWAIDRHLLLDVVNLEVTPKT